MQAYLLAGVATAITLAGGLVALKQQAYRAAIFAFCGGALIAAALVEILPDAHELLEAADAGFHVGHLLTACALGYFVFYLIDHVAHGGHVHHGAPHSDIHQAGLWGAAGLGLHSFFDGVAIGQAFQAGESIGWAVAVGVALHKLADGASVAGVMLGTQFSEQATARMVYLVAAAPLLGVLLQSFVTLAPAMLALLLGWFAGVFLYLGASSLLPAAHESSSSRVLLVATLGGGLFIFVARSLAH